MCNLELFCNIIPYMHMNTLSNSLPSCVCAFFFKFFLFSTIYTRNNKRRKFNLSSLSLSIALVLLCLLYTCLLCVGYARARARLFDLTTSTSCIFNSTKNNKRHGARSLSLSSYFHYILDQSFVKKDTRIILRRHMYI